jgi:hypothetical protein
MNLSIAEIVVHQQPSLPREWVVERGSANSECAQSEALTTRNPYGVDDLCIAALARSSTTSLSDRFTTESSLVLS